MIYRALDVIQIFLADKQANEGVPRGPRGPKNWNISAVNSYIFQTLNFLGHFDIIP